MSTTECEAFLPNNGCIAIANGKGCITETTVKTCSSYTSFGAKVCSGLKAGDGNCVWNTNTLTCDLISCENDTISNTDE